MTKISRKSLVELASMLNAQDVTYIREEEAKEIRTLEGWFKDIAWSQGTYGCTASLFQGANTGKYYVITARTSALYMF